MDLLELCGEQGGRADQPSPHRCQCVRLIRHDASGQTETDWHQCACGTKWTDTQELEAAFELSDEEKATVAEFLKVRDYSARMNAFSIDIGGGLAARVGAILERLL
jgi:hypothetical protein